MHAKITVHSSNAEPLAETADGNQRAARPLAPTLPKPRGEHTYRRSKRKTLQLDIELDIEPDIFLNVLLCDFVWRLRRGDFRYT